MSSTIRPNMATKRRQASYPKRSLPVSSMRPLTVCSLRPRLRTVSIMPGMLKAAPERTLTSSGSFGSPKPLPVSCSSAAMWASTSSHRPGGSSLPAA